MLKKIIKKLLLLFHFQKINSSFKDVLNDKAAVNFSEFDPCCRIRLISLADVMIFSKREYLDALEKCRSWKENTVVAVATGRPLLLFVNNIIPRLESNIILMAIDYPYVGTDSSVNFNNKLLQSDKISRFFAENWFGDLHPKLTIIPIGTESPFSDGSLYGNTTEKKFLEICFEQEIPHNKPLRILSNAHLNKAPLPASGMPAQRLQMENSLRVNRLCDFWDKRESREKTWMLHKNYAFELCPEGNGLDTHRFYEAIWLNTIPIVKKNSLSSMYKKFGCLIVENWDDINEGLLKGCLSNYISNKELLIMRYYRNLIVG